VITRAENALTRLSHLEARAEPGNFRTLFGLIDEFSGIAGSQAGIEKDALPFVSQKSIIVASKLMDCINESLVIGLLRAFEEPDQKNEFEQELGTVFRALHTEKRRHNFLSVLVFSSMACTASHLLSIYPDELASWSIILQAIDHFPALARLSARCDCALLRSSWANWAELTERSWRSCGYEPIMLRQAFRKIRFDALGTWIQTFQTAGPQVIPLLEECTSKLRMALSFLLTVEAPNWRIAPFSNLYDGASLAGILRELLSHNLELISFDDPVYEAVWPPALRHLGAGPESRLCNLRVGTLRRRRYLVELPDIACLSRYPALSVRHEWDADPVEFTRKNVHSIPVSNTVEMLQRSIEEIERVLFAARIAATGEKLKATLNPILEDVTPETLAILLVESLKITPFSAPIFTYILRRLHRLLAKSKDSAS
jgi:hypothetical protein